MNATRLPAAGTHPTPLQPTRPLTATTRRTLVVSTLLILALIRLDNLTYNSLFIDEAIYVTVGHEILAGITEQNALSWMFGSYLYPITAALADTLGGVTGLRLLSVVLGLMTAGCVFLAARRLFGFWAGLAALLLFGFSGPAISLSQQAVYDTMSAAFLAATLYSVIAAAQEPARERWYLLGAGLAFSLAVLAKYIALLCLPILLAAALLLYRRRYPGLRAILADMQWVYFAVPLIAILGGYGLTNLNDLLAVVSGDYARQISPRPLILRTIVGEAGLVLALALMGILAAAGRRAGETASPLPHLPALLAGAGIALLLLMLPAYHLASANIRALSKHLVFVLLFAAPLAGFALVWLATALSSVTRGSPLVRGAGAVLTVFGAVTYAYSGFQQHLRFQYSWMNTDPVVAYLQERGINRDMNIVASGSAIYEYYLGMGPAANRDIWSSIWYAEYEGLTGTEAVAVLVEACMVDLVITDTYYAPDIQNRLDPLLARAGYIAAFRDTQELHIGARITTTVYEPGRAGACTARTQP